ncbi:MAG: TlpA family protein disulfide reductase [Gemmatimonas sp.]
MNRTSNTLRLLGVALFAITASILPAQDVGIAVGSKAPTAEVQTLDGKTVALSSYMAGMPVVMEFWATWCPLCKKLEPSLAAAKEKYAGKVRFVGVGVSQNQSAERQQTFITQQKLKGDFVFDANNAATAAYKVPHTSYVVVVDAAGTVVYTGVGAEQDIDAAVQRAFVKK